VATARHAHRRFLDRGQRDLVLVCAARGPMFD
jgi:hypothetical protein